MHAGGSRGARGFRRRAGCVPPSAATRPDDHVEARRLAGAVRAPAGRPLRRSPRRARRREQPYAPCSVSASAPRRVGSNDPHAVPALQRRLRPAAPAQAQPPARRIFRGRREFSGRRERQWWLRPWSPRPCRVPLPGSPSLLGWNVPRTRSSAACPRRHRRRRRAPLGLEQLGRGVVRDVVAADLVGAALQDCVVEELELFLGAVVLRALRPAFVVALGVVALLAERRADCRTPSPTASCRRSA